MSQQEASQIALENGYRIQKFNRKRVHWRVCTALTVLHDDVSPYRTFTLIPFFYLFDYGHTLGMVDNAISPQDLQNKALSSELHILTLTANSGWKVPRKGDLSSLTGMTVAQLREVGMQNGLVLEYDATIGEPQKILPNPVPQGHDRLSDKGEYHIKSVTGINDAERGMDSPEVSGVAISAKQFQAKMQMADPLDNLAYTRTLLGRKILELRQDYTTAEQLFVIADKDKQTGEEVQEQVVVNQMDAYGRVLNDITVGEYDVEVSTAPMAATHEESQFKQAIEMQQAGIVLPPDVVIRLSNLDDKYEIAKRMSTPQADPKAEAEAEMIKAKIALLAAQRKLAIANATNTNVQALFGATNAGRTIASMPQVAPLADEIALSAGFEDANAAPVIPSVPGTVPGLMPAPVPQENTSPNFPPQADSGVTAGIEGGQA
jgi:hypothetical protein